MWDAKRIAIVLDAFHKRIWSQLGNAEDMMSPVHRDQTAQEFHMTAFWASTVFSEVEHREGQSPGSSPDILVASWLNPFPEGHCTNLPFPSIVLTVLNALRGCWIFSKHFLDKEQKMRHPYLPLFIGKFGLGQARRKVWICISGPATSELF